MAMNNMNHLRRVTGCVAAGLLGLALNACVDQWDDATQQGGQTAAQRAIAFTGNVASIRQATRADGSIINLNETSLPETKERTYYRADATGNVPTEVTKMTYYAGIFGAYTGQYTWASLVALKAVMDDRSISDDEFSTLKAGYESEYSAYSDKSALQTDAPTILDTYYTASQMYNEKATIGAYTNTERPMLLQGCRKVLGCIQPDRAGKK